MNLSGKFGRVILAITCLLSQSAQAAEPLRVLTTFTVLQDMAQNVAGEAAEVVSITRPGAEIHNYQPTPKDIARSRGADLVLYNGMNLELWFEKFLSRLGDVPSATLSEGVEPMSINQGPYGGKPNPHAWMSADSAMIYTDNIRDALSEADPDNAALYASNALAYQQRIREAMQPLKAALDAIPSEQRWLVSSEGAFSYLARDLNLKELYLWPINADSQGTPQQVRRVIDTIKQENIPVVFSESTVSPKPAQQIARETGITYGGVLYVDSLSQSDGPVPSYLDLLRVTVETIVQGLSTAHAESQ